MAVIEDEGPSTPFSQKSDIPLIQLKAEEGSSDVVINPKLSQKEKSELQDVVACHARILTDLPLCTHLMECGLDLSDTEPVFVRQYPLPFKLSCHRSGAVASLSSRTKRQPCLT